MAALAPGPQVPVTAPGRIVVPMRRGQHHPCYALPG
jgi:hypothetical protein